jgi:hypothetical protein
MRSADLTSQIPSLEVDDPALERDGDRVGAIVGAKLREAHVVVSMEVVVGSIKQKRALMKDSKQMYGVQRNGVGKTESREAINGGICRRLRLI